MDRPVILTKVRTLAHVVRHTACLRRPRPGGLVAVGDSITEGRGLPRYGLLADNSWLSYVVRNRAIPYGYNDARSGQTTEELVRRLPPMLDRHPAVVVVASGTNDTSPPDTIRLIGQAVEAIGRAGAKPVLCTVAPRRERAADVAALNAGLRQLAARHHLPLIDFHAVLADGDDFKPGLSEDGVHPNVAASRLMAQAAEPVLIDAFARLGHSL